MLFTIEDSASRSKPVQHFPERIHVTPGSHLLSFAISKLWGHVETRTDLLIEQRNAITIFFEAQSKIPNGGIEPWFTQEYIIWLDILTSD